jgi:hypothetical protein
MIEIEAPDGSIAEFPDGTPDATIKAVMRKAYGGGQQPSTVSDMLATVPAGLARAAASIPGMIGDLPRGAEYVADWTVGKIAGKTPEQVRTDRLARQQEAAEQSGIPRLPNPQDLISTEKVLEAVQPVTGELYQPQTKAGKYLDTTLSFLPAAVSPGSALQRAGQVVVPAVASEAAGQATEGTFLEPAARIAAAIAGGGTVALASRNGVPERMAGQAMAALDDAALARAGRLMIDAERQGIPLTWPEAIQQVTNSATRLTDLQRVVENSERGGPIMREFYADRPAQVQAAGMQQFEQIAPNPLIPEVVGPRVQRAAEGEIDATQAAINRQTRPLYNAAANQVLPPNHPALQDPAFLEAVRQVRADPIVGPRLANLPDNSIGVIDEVQKRLRDDRDALRAQGRGYAASLTGEARRQVSNAARNQSPEYDAAVQMQRQSRQAYLNPLEQGPTGKLAGTTDVGNQTRAMFPSQPQAGSEAGVERAMRGIRRTDPEAAANLVRQHLETRFNEATQRIQSGENPMGGAKFSSAIAGNPQQRANLAAALRALPNGSTLWRGFNRFLDVLEATGKRPTPNSMTRFNDEMIKELERGPLTQEAAAIVASPQKAFSYIKDNYARFRLGRGTEQLARLFTQGNLSDFRRLLNHGPGSPQAVAVMVRFLSQINAANNASSAPAN